MSRRPISPRVADDHCCNSHVMHGWQCIDIYTGNNKMNFKKRNLIRSFNKNFNHQIFSTPLNKAHQWDLHLTATCVQSLWLLYSNPLYYTDDIYMLQYYIAISQLIQQVYFTWAIPVYRRESFVMYLKDPKRVKQRIRRKTETLNWRESSTAFSGLLWHRRFCLAKRTHAKGNLRICGLREMIIAGSVVLASLIQSPIRSLSCHSKK